MNFLSTGVKEVTRRVRRQQNRRSLAAARRYADRAQIELGRHGWRALAEDETIRPPFEALLKLNAQVDAANAHIAELEAKVHEQEQERENARRENKADLHQIEQERHPVQQALHALQTRLAELQKALHEQNVKKAAFETEQAALNKSDQRLNNTRFPDVNRDERLHQSAQRREIIAEQIATLEFARTGFSESLTAAEEEIKSVRAALLDLDHRATQARTSLAARERAAAVAIAALVKQIALTRRQVKHVEEQKDEPYLPIGRRIDELGLAPVGAESQAAEARRRRQSYERLLALEAAWMRESREANKQDLRVFNFVIITVGVLVAATTLLFFRTPPRRDWLPARTETIVTFNVSRFTETEFSRALQSQEPQIWREVWTGLTRQAAEFQEIDVARQVKRITRALAPPPNGGPSTNYLLVEMKPFMAVDALIDGLWKRNQGGYNHRWVNGLYIYERAVDQPAIAQIGPSTLALGPWQSVEELIKVRLGLRKDLKSDAPIVIASQLLSEENVFRLVTQRPAALIQPTNPLLDAQILADCQALGLTFDLREPLTATFLFTTTNRQAMERIAKQLQSAPEQALQFQNAGPRPLSGNNVTPRDQQVEWRFRLSGSAAREFLQRVSHMDLAGSNARPAPSSP